MFLFKIFNFPKAWNRSALTEHLEKSGAHVNYGKPQKAENITDDIDLVVYTAAVHADNQEFSRAKELQLPMLSRAEFLGQLMKNYDTPIAVSGTHGKTTTTSMISEILLQANTDPTLSVGGILKSIHGNIRVGHSGLFVAEACEYTNSFLSFFPKIGIILNIEEDHLDFFKDLADIRASFRKFAQLLPANLFQFGAKVNMSHCEVLWKTSQGMTKCVIVGIVGTVLAIVAGIVMLRKKEV